MEAETGDELYAFAARLREQLGVRVLSISVFEADRTVLRTLCNVGQLEPGDEARPAEERYGVDAFPVLNRVLRGESYTFGGTMDADVASAALAMSYRIGRQAGVPIHVAGAVWGEIWIADGEEGDRFDEATLRELQRGAEHAAALIDDDA